MKKINIFLDTNVFRKDVTLNSAPMHALKNYSRASFIDVFASEISINEFRTQINHNLTEEIYNIQRSYSKILNYFPKKMKYDLFQWQINEKEEEIKSLYEAQWKSFLEELNLNILYFDFEDAKEVMRKYFAGELPYNSVKNRNDIPDAFIFLSLLKIKNIKDDIIFISSDKNLIKHASAENIECFEGLSEFLKSDKIIRIYETIDNSPKKDKLRSIITLHKNEFIELVSRLINRSDELLDDYTRFYENQIENFMEDLQIDYSVNVSTINFNLNNLIDYSSEAFSLKINASVEVELMYNLDKGELKYLGEERVRSFKSFEESNFFNYYNVTENKTEKIIGTIGIIFEENISSSNFSIENLKISLENIYSG